MLRWSQVRLRTSIGPEDQDRSPTEPLLQKYDIAVIGGGIAGASVASELASSDRKVVLLEMESQPGYHTTGRSAALFASSYGPAPIRALTRAARKFFAAPPEGFCDVSLFAPRGELVISRADQLESLNELADDVSDSLKISLLNEQQLREANPLVREGYAAAGFLDETSYDIDVNALHQGYLRVVRSHGGVIMTNAEVLNLQGGRNDWRLHTRSGDIEANIVVNAAGAWADHVGQMAGAERIGLVPKRRTIATISPPETVEVASYPATVDVDEDFYLKPDAGKLLISPADETPSEPCDAQPEELDIAICVDRIEKAFDLSVRRIENKWAGLRSFVSDKCPVAGFSQSAEGFFWLAGQGGYGIQSSPALSRFAAAQILGDPVPQDILDQDLNPADLAPQRLG